MQIDPILEDLRDILTRENRQGVTRDAVRYLTEHLDEVAGESDADGLALVGLQALPVPADLDTRAGAAAFLVGDFAAWMHLVVERIELGKADDQDVTMLLDLLSLAQGVGEMLQGKRLEVTQRHRVSVSRLGRLVAELDDGGDNAMSLDLLGRTIERADEERPVAG